MQTEKTKSVPGLILPQPDFFNTPHPFFGTAIMVPSKGANEYSRTKAALPTKTCRRPVHQNEAIFGTQEPFAEARTSAFTTVCPTQFNR